MVFVFLCISGKILNNVFDGVATTGTIALFILFRTSNTFPAGSFIGILQFCCPFFFDIDFVDSYLSVLLYHLHVF